MKTEFYLMLIIGDTDAELLPKEGHFENSYELQQCLIDLLRTGYLRRDEDGKHELRLIGGRPFVYNFSSGYMDNLVAVAEGRAQDINPDFPLEPKPKGKNEKNKSAPDPSPDLGESSPGLPICRKRKSEPGWCKGD